MENVVAISDHDIVVIETPQDSVVVIQEQAPVVSEQGASITILTPVDALTVVEQVPELLVVEEPQTIAIVTHGEQGPPGRDGSGPVEINFAFGDATPSQLLVAPAGKLIYSVAIHIRQSFDGIGAALTVGDAATPDRLMAALENDPALVGSNSTAPAVSYDVDTPILLSITPGAGASQGAGLVILTVEQ